MVIAEVEGEFKEYEATVTSTSDDFNGASVEFTAQVSSIDTDSERRDGHLKSDDFFNAEKFPTITFKGKLVKKGKKYALKGDFTMRDVTKKVSFPVKFNGTVDTGRGMKAGFIVEGSVKRFEYGLKYDNAIANGSYVVGDEVEILCKLELNKAK
jgi:polyisoprenoid-binding protein YceI